MFWPSKALLREPRDRRAARFGELVARRPLLMLAASVTLLAALAAGTIGLRMDYGRGDSGPQTAAAATAVEISHALPQWLCRTRRASTSPSRTGAPSARTG